MISSDVIRRGSLVTGSVIADPIVRQDHGPQGRMRPVVICPPGRLSRRSLIEYSIISSNTENARAFALLNMAMSDALVSIFDTKYH
jgi:hypothetical protein